MADTTLQEVINALKDQGDLTRNTGSNSLKALREGLSDTIRNTSMEISNNIIKLTEALVEGQTKAAEAAKEIASKQAAAAALADKQPVQSGPRGEGVKNVGTGVGAAASGIGKGLGFAALGGAALMGLSSMLTLDADAIKSKVSTLLSIADLPGMTVKNVAGVGLTLGALGVGLAAFGIGGGIAGIGDAVAKFTSGDNWPERIKSNVEKLLSIADLPNMTAGAVAGVSATMGALGAGLAAFGAGSAVAGVGAGINAAVEKFGGGGNWVDNIVTDVTKLVNLATSWNWGTVAGAVVKFPTVMGALGAGLALFGAGKAVEGVGAVVQNGAAYVDKFSSGGGFGERVHKEVTSLLNILDHKNAGFGGAASFIATMGGIGAGLVAFSIGKGAEAIAEGGQAGVKSFTEGKPFAERVKSEVETLLSIMSLPGIEGKNVAGFALTMGGIGAGLAAFSLGKGAEAIAAGAQGAISKFTDDQGFAQRIKSEVETLMSIPALAENAGGTETLKKAMSDIGEALSTFAGDKLSSAFKNLGSAALGFLSGDKGPVAEMLSLADKSDDLTKAADALTKIGNALESFGKIKIKAGDLDFEALGKNIAGSLPLLQGLAQGGFPTAASGVIKMPGWFSSNIDVPSGGVFDPKLRLEELAPAMQKIQAALGMQVAATQTAIPAAAVPDATGTGAGGAGTAILSAPTNASDNSTTNNVTNNYNTYNYNYPPGAAKTAGGAAGQ